MSVAKTEIAWCDATWNCIRGCSRVSEGCRHCFAERIAARFSGPGAPFHGFAHRIGGEARWTGKVALIPEALDWPLRRKKPMRIFVNSMSDLFHEGLPFEDIAAVFGVMAACQRHTFQVLTKRAGRMREWFEWLPSHYAGPRRVPAWATPNLERRLKAAPEARWPLPNVWLGVSAEDQATLDARVSDLLRCPAAVRWVSLEPQLGPVDVRPWLPFDGSLLGTGARGDNLQWVVQGGESGPRARPFDLAWARSVRDQCREAGVAYFMKQLGARPRGHAARSLDLKHRAGADPAEWPEDLRVQQFPEVRR